MRQLILLGTLALFTPFLVYGGQTSKNAEAQTTPAYPAGMPPPLPKPKGILSWRILGRVETLRTEKSFIPKFDAAITALNGKEVKLQGFMLPLESSSKHKRFLLSGNVPSCPFCMPGGPESLVEVLCKDGIEYVMDPIILSGKFSVLKDDPSGIWYRLTDARLVPAGKL